MAEVTVRVFAAAAHAAGFDEVPVAGGSLAQVLDAVTERAADPARFAQVLAQCSVLVDGLVSDPDAEMHVPAGAMVDVLPPFAGG